MMQFKLDEATLALVKGLTGPTTIAVKKDTYPIVYKLYRTSDTTGWKIFDVITDEVSLVRNYRTQFKTGEYCLHHLVTIHHQDCDAIALANP